MVLVVYLGHVGFFLRCSRAVLIFFSRRKQFFFGGKGLISSQIEELRGKSGALSIETRVREPPPLPVLFLVLGRLEEEYINLPAISQLLLLIYYCDRFVDSIIIVVRCFFR